MLRPLYLKFLCMWLALVALPAMDLAARQRSPSLSLESVNNASWQERGKPSTSVLVKLQVALDRAHASPGEIDGTLGENTRKAIAAYAELKGLEPTNQLTEDLWRAITRRTRAALSRKEFLRISAPRQTWSGLAIQARGSFWLRSST